MTRSFKLYFLKAEVAILHYTAALLWRFSTRMERIIATSKNVFVKQCSAYADSARYERVTTIEWMVVGCQLSVSGTSYFARPRDANRELGVEQGRFYTGVLISP